MGLSFSSHLSQLLHLFCTKLSLQLPETKGPNASVRPCPQNARTCGPHLERQLEPQLHGAGPSRTYGGISGCDVRCSASATKVSRSGIVESKTILSAIGIGKIRMVEN